MDIVEIDRIQRALTSPKFIERVFTLAEQEYCQSRGKQSAASYAARFAGKEAVLKAFGTGLSGGSLQDIEVLCDQKGCPKVTLYGYYACLATEYGIRTIQISLTHARTYAAATAIFEGGTRE
jgi:holo-[acyl-carrier protein] synthase